MTTIPDAVLQTFTDNWGNGGGGGAIPKLYNSEDITDSPGDDETYIQAVNTSLFSTLAKRENDKFANYEHTLELIVNTGENVAATKREDRLKEIADEMKYILLNAPIDGATKQEWEIDDNIGAPDLYFWRSVMTIRIFSDMQESSMAWGSGTTITLTTERLTVNEWAHITGLRLDDDAMTDSGDNEILASDGSGNVTIGGTVTPGGDLIMGGNEIEFTAAKFHSSGSELHIHPTTGNEQGHLLIHPSGTENQSQLRLRNSVSGNYGYVELDINGTDVSLISGKSGSGTAPDTLNLNDADWDIINIGDGAATVNIKGVAYSRYTDPEAVAALEAESTVQPTGSWTFTESGTDTVVVIDCEVNEDSMLLFKENGVNKFELRYDSSQNRFELNSSAGGANIVFGDAGTLNLSGAAVKIVGDLTTNSDKDSDIGASGTAWDNVYADDFVNESPFKEFEDPISELKKIKSNSKKDRMDYDKLPDFVRAHTRDPSKHKWETVINAAGDEEDQIIELAPKDIIATKGFSVNRMTILLYQALQKAIERIEILEGS